MKTTKTIIYLASILLFVSCGGGDNVKHSKFSAAYDSRQFVERLIKSPSTAEYFTDMERHVNRRNDTTFVINGWFDSQNSFGATIRSNYSCIVTYYDSKGLLGCTNVVIR